MARFDVLSTEKLTAMQDVRAHIHDSVTAIVNIGAGGWNHGPKLMRAHADAIHQLKTAEALLVEGSLEGEE